MYTYRRHKVSNIFRYKKGARLLTVRAEWTLWYKAQPWHVLLHDAIDAPAKCSAAVVDRIRNVVGGGEVRVQFEGATHPFQRNGRRNPLGNR